jgi:hypothetical protein
MSIMVLLAVLWINDAYGQDKENSKDIADISALVQNYSKYEDEGKIDEQARLMVKNRISISADGRRTNNETYMRFQQENFISNKQRFPDVKYYREVRDLQIRKFGTMAIASFEWYCNTVIPGDMPDEKRVQVSTPAPVFVTHVLIKSKEGWKIFHTHTSNIQ